MNWAKAENNSNSIPKVKNHTVVLHKRLLYIYAGFDGSKHKNNLTVIDLHSNQVTPIETSEFLPYGRNGHTATLYNSLVYIIGGWNSSYLLTTKEIYSLCLDTMVWEKITPLGEPMVSCNMHSANLYNHCIYVFRGGDGINYLNTLHYYDIQKNTWNSVVQYGTPPSPRANHASAVNGDILYIFGGWNGVDRLNDLLSLNFLTMSWEKILAAGDVPRPRAGMSLNSIRGELLMFGGSGVSSTSYNDLYIFNVEKATWTEANVTGEIPPPRAGHTMTAISNRELILIGGSSGNHYSPDYYILDSCPPPAIPRPGKSPVLCFRDLCNNSQFSDIQFLIEDTRIFAHKVIITRLSEHFRIMLMSGMRESIENLVEFKNIKLPIFMILLKYLYTGEVEIDAGTEGQETSTEFLIELLHGADRFLLDPIAETCENILLQRVNKHNAVVILSQIENARTRVLKEYCDWVLSNEI